MPKIAIVGAGINGLALAISLRQLGFAAEDISIYEKSDVARAEGTGIIFWAEALTLLKKIGIDLIPVGVCLPNLTSIFLQEIAKSEVVNIAKEPEKAAYGFMREKIYTALMEKAKSLQLHIKTGYECHEVQDNKDNCTIRFTNGSSVNADVVIGCDGIHSTIRHQLWPSVQPIDLNIKAVRGIFTCDETQRKQLQLPLDACHIYCGNQYRVLLYPNGIDPQTQQYSYYVFTAHRVSPDEVNSDENTQQMLGRLPLCPDNIRTIIHGTPPTQTIRSRTLRQLPFSRSTQGRIALLGDSAHAMAPTAGLGFLLGITNALFLAGYLSLNRENVPFALGQYDRAIAEHSRACLDHTLQLTDLFYVDNPMSSRAKTGEVYAKLYALIAESAGKAFSFYDSALQTCVADAIKDDSGNREYRPSQHTSATTSTGPVTQLDDIPHQTSSQNRFT